ncbi:ABC transporter permease [Zavarzinia sp. CC-PAN008]|uniref:ABC transporter permease n=1 Tax=Zavarzinia sp. CC-PAN008 TaxID=3243332 RepID=UPI003F749888
MSAVAVPGLGNRLSGALHRRRALRLALLLALPLGWLGIVYLGSLGALLAQSFFRIDDFTGQVVREWGLSTYAQVLTPANVAVIVRTVTMAALVTLACVALALPLAYVMARRAGPRMQALLFLGVMLPLWSSYLVRIYAWKLILAGEGIVSWAARSTGTSGLIEALLAVPGIGGPSLSTSYVGTFVVFTYVWLPYMVLPVFAALERVPESVIQASGDLGARPFQTFRHVILPLAMPGIAAGSIFTFSLTLGDYIIPNVIGPSRPFIGNIVLLQQGTAGNVPLAAALSVVPIAIMVVYLWLAGRMGAFRAL